MVAEPRKPPQLAIGAVIMSKGKIIGTKGFTKPEFLALKELARKEISFKVSMKQHTQKYAMGGFQISPRVYRKKGETFELPKWTREEFKEVIDFLIRNDIVITGRAINSPIDEVSPTMDGTVFDKQYLLWSNYFSYMTKAIREEDRGTVV
jgi:hypothetical protein